MYGFVETFDRNRLTQVGRVCGNDLVVGVGLAGENDHGNGFEVWVAFPFSEKGPAVHDWHFKVEEDAGRGWRRMKQIVESLGPVGALDHIVTFYLQDGSNNLTGIIIVIDHQNDLMTRIFAG